MSDDRDDLGDLEYPVTTPEPSTGLEEDFDEATYLQQAFVSVEEQDIKQQQADFDALLDEIEQAAYESAPVDKSAPALRVIPGGRSNPQAPPQAAPADFNPTGETPMLAAPLIPKDYRDEAILDPRLARTWPPVVEPMSLFDLQLRDDMWPRDGFLGQYLDWIETSTDAPRPFHIMTALTTLSTALGRNWRIAHRNGGLYSNLYVLLIADSGTRKSTAMEVHRKLLPLARIWNRPQESGLSLLEALQRQNTVLWYFDEAAAFFDMIQKRIFGPQIASRLTPAYDGTPVEYESKRASIVQVPDPHLSILMGAPLAWLREKRLSLDFLQGGIFARFLVVPAARTRRLADPPPPDEANEENFMIWLDALTKAGGSYLLRMSERARQEYLAWVESRGDEPDPLLAAAWNRAGAVVKKLALLYHVASLRSANTPVQLDSVEQAINMVQNYLLPGHLWATKRLQQVNPYQVSLYRLEEVLETTPSGIQYTDVAKLLGASVEYAHKLLYTLWLAKQLSFWKWRSGGIWQKRGTTTVLVSRYDRRPINRPGYIDPVDLPKALKKYASSLGDEPEDETPESESTLYDIDQVLDVYDEQAEGWERFLREQDD